MAREKRDRLREGDPTAFRLSKELRPVFERLQFAPLYPTGERVEDSAAAAEGPPRFASRKAKAICCSVNLDFSESGRQTKTGFSPKSSTSAVIRNQGEAHEGVPTRMDLPNGHNRADWGERALLGKALEPDHCYVIRRGYTIDAIDDFSTTRPLRSIAQTGTLTCGNQDL